MTLHNRKYLESRRKRLRNEGTKAEAVFWNYVKGKQLDGRKFRRQHSIGNYIVDFYCPGEKLIIELDGSVHDTEERVALDRIRQEYLEALGFTVLRFRNEEVFQATQVVLAKIREHWHRESQNQ